MPDTVELTTFDEAVQYGDAWRAEAMRLQRENVRLHRELGMQRTFADVFAEQWHRLYWER